MPDFTPSTQRVEFDLKAYLRGSEKERAEIYKILFDIGAITTDEIRQMEDMISMKLTTPMQITAADSDSRTITGRIVAFNEHSKCINRKSCFCSRINSAR
jgi:hypothetical protein